MHKTYGTCNDCGRARCKCEAQENPKTMHTPTPWKLDESNPDGFYIEGKDGVYVTDCGIIHRKRTLETCKANAAFIVTACNAHESMKIALENIKNEAEWWLKEGMPTKALVEGVIREAKEALAKAVVK